MPSKSAGSPNATSPRAPTAGFPSLAGRSASEITEFARLMARDGRDFFNHGWLAGTSGNLSVRLNAELFLITASGRHKGLLSEGDFLVCDLHGRPAHETPLRPSAETLLHCAIYEQLPDCGAVYHVHQLHAALCSRRDGVGQATTLQGVEMIKGLDVWEDNASIAVPIIENHRHIPTLGRAVRDWLAGPAFDARIPGVNIHAHGIYAWGKGPFEARRHVETFGYLFEFSWEWERYRKG